MKLVTFVMNEHHSLVTTFLIFVKVFNRKSLALCKIETVPVPLNGLNKTADSYSTVPISKLIWPLNMCILSSHAFKSCTCVSILTMSTSAKKYSLVTHI